MKKIVYVDMDNVLVDFPAAIPHVPKELREQHSDALEHVPGIFGLMPPLAGAVEAYHQLSRHFDTYILSTAPWENPSAWSDKLVWVKRHLGEPAHKRLILSHNKHLNRGDYLIDDRQKNGADRFQGELILFGSERFPDWAAVKKYLLPA